MTGSRKTLAYDGLRPAGPRQRLTPVTAILMCLIALAACATMPARAASSWWNSDWQYRKSISVKLPAPANGPDSAATVMPIRLHAGNFQYFADLQPSGADLRFIAPDGSALKYQIELLDATAGVLIAWVEIPPRLPADEPIWMYYGNARAAKPDDATLYDSNQLLVLHFAESQGVPRDATANHYDASPTSVQLGVPGVIGNGARFDGHSAIRIAARPGLALPAGGGFTFSAWVRSESESPRAILYSQSQGGTHLEVGIAGRKLYAEVGDGRQVNRVESSADLPPGRWQHVAATIGTDLALYIDGTPSGTAANGHLPQMTGDVLIGGPGLADVEGGFSGLMDEVQVSKVARSASWLRISALAQSPEATLVTYGTDESRGTTGKLVAYLAMMRNLLSQVSLDGLVVITITLLMGMASMQVLINKAALLRHIEQQDAKFLQSFAEGFAGDVAASARGRGVAANETLQASGLQQLYLAGLKAVQAATMAAGAAACEKLSLGAEAFEAVRSALDAALVEATNNMNARLVVMTVAIAGAPFLGLLGTVVGVMITFASIAAAGDVNVNTIAPGVAAAMTATVVGLLVAIPSLFGYNWIATRIARRTAAMEVFADRFVSMLALQAAATRERAPEAAREVPERSSYAA